MADKDYVLTRLADNIEDKAVLTYDALNDMIVDSGITAEDGDMQASAGTVKVGLQDMSSAGEQVIWRNRHSEVNYAPPWHVIDEVNPGGSHDRFYEDMQTVDRFTDTSGVLEDPSFDVSVPVDEVVYRLTFTTEEAHPKAQLRIMQDQFEMWRQLLVLSAGTNTYELNIPIAFYTGNYRLELHDYKTGTPVRVRGNPQTGEMAYTVHFRKFSEKPLATKDYVDNAVAGGVGTDLMTKAVYDTNNDGKVDRAKLADRIYNANTSGNDKYYGTDSSGTVGFHDLPAGADESALRAEIKANKDKIDDHETAIEGHGTQLAAHAKQIATNDKNARTAITTGQSALQESNTVRNNMPNQITAEVNHTAKTITLKLMSQTGLVDAVLIDLSSWFSGSGTNPGVTHKLYYGFSQNPPMSESEILRLSSGTKTIDKLAGTEISMTRSDSTPKYMYVWIPDTAGTVKGFTFSGFLSTWQATAINVAGIDGKFYVSPNKTAATSVAFEVTV